MRPARVLVTALLTAAAALVPATSGWAAEDSYPTPEQARASEWWLDSLGVSKVQAEGDRGQGVTVCVLDSGVEPNHPSLQATKVVPGAGFGPKTTPDGLTDVSIDFHGTSMAMLLAGSGDANGGGVLGVAPAVTVVSVALGEPPHASQVDALKQRGDTVKACVDHGASVISMSFVAQMDPRALAYAQARDVVLVAGAGNDAITTSIGSPADQFGVIGVGGVDATLAIDPNSNSGGYLRSNLSAQPDLTVDRAGVAVMGPFSTKAGPTGSDCDQGFAMVGPVGIAPYRLGCGGTSAATAIVSGVVALVRSAHPELNAANVVNRVLATATVPTGQAAGQQLPSPKFGYGVVNAYAAVTAKVPTVQANPLGSLYTGSEGVWNPSAQPSKPEPQVGKVPAAGPWEDQAVGTPKLVSAPSPSTGSDSSSGSGGSTIVLALVGGGLAILLVVGLAVFLVRRSRRGDVPAG